MMEADAFSSFVSVDMDLQQPLLVIGLLSDVQYADTADAVELTAAEPAAAELAGEDGNAAVAVSVATPGVRRFRHSLEVLKRAVQFWRSKGGVSFVSYLGNAIAAENAAAGAQWTALESYNEERGRLGIEAWHHTPGDHDLGCFGSAQIASALMPCRTGGTFYYSFNACPGWRVLVLDSYDMSLLAHTPGSAAHTATLAYLQANNPNPLSAADPLEGLEGPDRRWGPSCGGLGETQLMWLGAQLSVAAATGERCIIMTRLGVLPEACDGEHLLFNFDAVQEKIDAQPGVSRRCVCPTHTNPPPAHPPTRKWTVPSSALEGEAPPPERAASTPQTDNSTPPLLWVVGRGTHPVCWRRAGRVWARRARGAPPRSPRCDQLRRERRRVRRAAGRQSTGSISACPYTWRCALCMQPCARPLPRCCDPL